MKVLKLIFAAAIILSFTSCTKQVTETEPVAKTDNIYQYGTMQKFLDRNFDGSLTIKELKKHGDFGLGTYNGVNGEMVVSEGRVYRILPSGEPFEVSEAELSPYTVVKFFEADTSFALNYTMSLEELKAYIKELIADTTKPVAIRISGEYEKAKTRTVEKQTKPYPSLDEIVANQIVFNFENIKGTAIGYWFPDYFETVNFPGFHFHFLKDGASGGGHLLDCTISNVTVELDYPEDLIVGF